MKSKKKLFAIPVLLAGLLAMIYAGRQMLETQQIYQEGNSAYEDISAQVRKHKAFDAVAIPETNIYFLQEGVQADAVGNAQLLQVEDEEEEMKVKVYVPSFEIDFGMLRDINKDAAAWLYSPDTVIDYPVMEAENYNYYLNHLPDGTLNANGSLFIDYNNAPDFSDELTIIYGHHMKSGRMFGNLVEYKKQDYFREHPYMYLYTEHENFRIDLMYGAVIGAGQWRENAFMFAENLDSLLGFASRNTTFESDVEYKAGDRIVVLSTCSYEFDNARFIVVGVLRSGGRP